MIVNNEIDHQGMPSGESFWNMPEVLANNSRQVRTSKIDRLDGCSSKTIKLGRATEAG
jgi:hypothetical protein